MKPISPPSLILHGADYNPDQWLHEPGVIDEDFRLLPLARMNSVSLGIFAWAALEPEEGVYRFEWMDDIFARAERGNIRVILATPSGAKPNWLALRYPEVRRVSPEGRRDAQGGRHNHCLTSPVYREKVRQINSLLAERYGRHPALVLWHLSNEYGGHCHCDLCWDAFRAWLRDRYGSLDALNHAWWSRFWSHTYTSWEQVTTIDSSIHGLGLDWKRFMTHQCRTFIRNEVDALRPASPGVPVTTNMMPTFQDYNYWELARELDVISWDSYQQWHTTSPEGDETGGSLHTAFNHDIFRSMKGGRPFLLMETTPSQVNWSPVSPLRRPGVHRLNSLEAVAHGADAVCYFQFRKSRGSTEKFHGAVVDHFGAEHTRVFRDVAAVGATLEKISAVAGGRVPAKVALIFDWENRWALEQSMGPQNAHKDYVPTALEHYEPFWKRGIAVDVVDEETDLSPYALVIAPMLYMVRGDLGERLTAFVEKGGTLVATYFSGLVDGTDLCFRTGFPGPLRKVLGIWVEETDPLPDGFTRRVDTASGAEHGLHGTYAARHYFDLVHLEGAKALAHYAEDFYAGRPAVTVNSFGAGKAFHVASRNDSRFQDDFLGGLARQLKLPRALPADLPDGVTAHRRVSGENAFLFLLNFKNAPARVDLGSAAFHDAETGEPVGGALELAPFGSRVLVAAVGPG